MSFGDVKNVTEIDLRDFPADVQDLLRQRAIESRRPIEAVIAEYVRQVSEEILQVAGAKKPTAPEAA